MTNQMLKCSELGTFGVKLPFFLIFLLFYLLHRVKMVMSTVFDFEIILRTNKRGELANFQ